VTLDAPHWAARLAELAAAHEVPGASLAVLHQDQTITATTGVVNVDTGVEVTPDAVFSIGSITKVYVATVVMRLAEAGLVDLDRPLAATLPGFRVADAETTERVAPRHLLSHTSGIAGDNFADTGRGDEALERFVEVCRDLGQDVPFAATMSYSNTGYSLLGRLIEQVTGQVWDAAMRTWLYEPLGLERTLTQPEDALRFRTAFGHERDADGRLGLVAEWDLTRSSGPAGGVCATASELLAFARAHLDGGATAAGEPLLTEDSVREMQRPHVDVPDRWTLADHWGLGWALRGVGGRRVYGHDGNGAGQSAFLTVVPDTRTALALQTNGGDRTQLGTALFGELLRELCDLELPAPLAPGAGPADGVPPGRYERFGVRIEIEGSPPTATLSLVEPLASQFAGQEPIPMEVRRSSDGDATFVARMGADEWLPLVAFEVAGEPYLHFGGRAMRRVA
jgi:CubicO group peptidase (beta-lactamase class C family)